MSSSSPASAIFRDNDERDPPDIEDRWRLASVEDLCYGFAREPIDVVPDTVPSLAAETAEPQLAPLTHRIRKAVAQRQPIDN